MLLLIEQFWNSLRQKSLKKGKWVGITVEVSTRDQSISIFTNLLGQVTIFMKYRDIILLTIKKFVEFMSLPQQNDIAISFY